MKSIFTLLLLITLSLPALCRANERADAVLREMNLARTNPREYAQIVASQGSLSSRGDQRALNEAVNFLNHARPLPPLTFSNGLAMGAMAHVMNQGGCGETGHQGVDRSSPWDRMARYGKWLGTAGENISYGFENPRQIVVSLIVDAGVGNRAHRKNIFNRGFGVVGVATGPHARWGAMCVMDFAGAFVDKEGITSETRKAPAVALGSASRNDRG